MPSIEELRRYAVLDPDGDVATLNMCMEAAKQWFANAGVAEPTEPNKLYDLGVYMLAVHYFDNRGAIGSKNDEQLPLGVFSIMHQLRL